MAAGNCSDRGNQNGSFQMDICCFIVMSEDRTDGLKSRLNEKWLQILFDNIPGHTVDLSDHVGKNCFRKNAFSVLTAASTRVGYRT